MTLSRPNDSYAGVLRAIDANANRFSEGLRVIEDFARFHLNDQFLAMRCKKVRHQIARELQPFATKLLHYRDTSHDVGTENRTNTEYQRYSPSDVVFASAKRSQQAIRTIEEFIKLIDSETASRIEQMRYAIYEIESSLHHVLTGRQSLQNVEICVLVDCQDSAKLFETKIARLVESNVGMLQLRDKTAADRILIERLERMRRITAHTHTLVMVNDRPDIARVVNADGVHVGQDDLAVAQARRVLSSNQLVGASTHSIQQARQAVDDGANYIGVGPTFPSETKSFDTFPGLEFLKRVAEELSIPAFAIGGIHKSNVASVVDTGISRIAVSRAVWGADDPGAAVGELQFALRRRS